MTEPASHGESPDEVELIELIPATSVPTIADTHCVPSRPWLTIALTLLIVGTYVVVTSIVVVGFLLASSEGFSPNNLESTIDELSSNGHVLAVATIVGNLIEVPLIFCFAWIVHRKAPLEFLGLSMPSVRSTVIWVLVTLAIIAIIDALSWLSGHYVVPEFMRTAYSTADNPLLLWFALVVAAPVAEELLFRGFLYRGLISTWMGLPGTAIITSLAWTSLHVQYGLFTLVYIFLTGIIFAVARHRTQSVIPCILMHMTMNLIATIETALVLS